MHLSKHIKESYNQSDLFRHSLSLVGQCRCVAVPSTITPCQFTELKFLENSSSMHVKVYLHMYKELNVNLLLSVSFPFLALPFPLLFSE